MLEKSLNIHIEIAYPIVAPRKRSDKGLNSFKFWSFEYLKVWIYLNGPGRAWWPRATYHSWSPPSEAPTYSTHRFQNSKNINFFEIESGSLILSSTWCPRNQFTHFKDVKIQNKRSLDQATHGQTLLLCLTIEYIYIIYLYNVCIEYSIRICRE
jgi:hypothetical protein